MYVFVNHENNHYKIMKINGKYPFNNINFKLYTKCISNYDLPNFLNKEICPTIKKLEYVNFADKLNEILLTISNNDTILHPIYISDNKLFD